MTKTTFPQFFQGDVWLMRIPESYSFDKEREISPRNHKLVLLEGEVTGHHHCVDVLDRTAKKEDIIAFEGLADIFNSPKLKKAFANNTAPKSTMYAATNIAAKLVQDGILLRPDLVIGFLEVENGPVKVVHPEHNSITIPPGKYVIGRQIESVAGEERRVTD